jgi:hypothetical protein
METCPTEGSKDAERGPLSMVFLGGNGDRGKTEGTEGAERGPFAKAKTLRVLETLRV